MSEMTAEITEKSDGTVIYRVECDSALNAAMAVVGLRQEVQKDEQ